MGQYDGLASQVNTPVLVPRVLSRHANDEISFPRDEFKGGRWEGEACPRAFHWQSLDM